MIEKYLLKGVYPQQSPPLVEPQVIYEARCPLNINATQLMHVCCRERVVQLQRSCCCRCVAKVGGYKSSQGRGIVPLNRRCPWGVSSEVIFPHVHGQPNPHRKIY